jgi:chitin synthase
MLQFAGMDLTNYFPPPLNKACPGLVNSSTLVTQYANFTPILNYAIHYSGAAQSDNDTKLDGEDWYYGRLQPFLKEYRKGWLVYKSSAVEQQAEDSSRYVVYDRRVRAGTDYNILDTGPSTRATSMISAITYTQPTTTPHPVALIYPTTRI